MAVLPPPLMIFLRRGFPPFSYKHHHLQETTCGDLFKGPNHPSLELSDQRHGTRQKVQGGAFQVGSNSEEDVILDLLQSFPASQSIRMDCT